jgi:hypothetical protein
MEVHVDEAVSCRVEGILPTLVCPNHHRAIHRCDGPFGFERSVFVFATMSEPLMRLRHKLAR